MIKRIINGKIIVKDKILEDKNLYFEDGKITAITDENLTFDEEIDAKGSFVSPGFIDIHVHGGGGSDFMDGGTAPIVNACKMHLTHGTTSIMPTTLACSDDVLVEFLHDLNTVKEEKMTPVNILGAHLEGPYFSLNQSGAQNPDYIKAPTRENYEKIIKEGNGIIKRWSFAPELAGSEEFCDAIIKEGILPSIAHSDAIYDDVKKVYDKGCNMVTHLYSGMSTITRHAGFRKLGVVESTYLLDGMNAEIIADGKHLPPELLRLIVKQLGTGHICLVTDSMRGSGMPSGESLLGRKGEAMPCIIEDGVAKLLDRTSFAGSVATTDRLVRTMVKEAGVSLCDAVKMMTANPARILNIKNKGLLNVGFDADIVVFDENINIKNVFVNGESYILEKEEA